MKPSEFDQPTYSPLRLQRGESLHIPVRRGTGVQVLAGALRVNESMRWIAETAVHSSRDVGEGEWLLLVEGGWLALHAEAGGVHLMLVEPAEPMARLWRRLRTLLLCGARLTGQQA